MKVSLSTILSWFETGDKPTQNQFQRVWSSFWHKDEKIPISSIENLSISLDLKADREAFENHVRDELMHGGVTREINIESHILVVRNGLIIEYKRGGINFDKIGETKIK